MLDEFAADSCPGTGGPCSSCCFCWFCCCFASTAVASVRAITISSFHDAGRIVLIDATNASVATNTAACAADAAADAADAAVDAEVEANAA